MLIAGDIGGTKTDLAIDSIESGAIAGSSVVRQIVVPCAKRISWAKGKAAKSRVRNRKRRGDLRE